MKGEGMRIARRSFAGVSVSLGFVLLVGCVFVAAQDQISTTLSGAVVDQVGGRVPGAQIAFKDASGLVRRLRSDEDGRYTIADVPEGAYAIEASMPGFATTSEDLAVGPQKRTHDITLRIGRAAETITVTMQGRAAVPQRTQRSPAQSSNLSEAKCTSRFPATGIGGEVRPPTKIRNQPPAYPGSLAAAPLSGSATAAGVIGSDGKMQSVVVIKASQREFGDEVVQSVRAWEFLPARINCVAFDMTLTVTVQFIVVR